MTWRAHGLQKTTNNFGLANSAISEMSAECSSCGKTCREPETIWYAGTRYDWNVYWVCGACVDAIPTNERHPTSELMEFQATFGPLKCETNSRGVYQGLTSKQKPPQFWVRIDVVAKYVPGGKDFTDRFYPYTELPDYLMRLAKGVRSGDIPKDGDRNRLLRDLTLMGPAVERHLHGPGELRRKSITPYALEALDARQRDLAEELLAEVLKRF